MLRPTPPGSADWPIGPWSCWIRRAGPCPPRIWLKRSTTSAATSPFTADRSPKGRKSFWLPPERWPRLTDPERAVVMLAEAAYASFYAA